MATVAGPPGSGATRGGDGRDRMVGGSQVGAVVEPRRPPRTVSGPELAAAPLVVRRVEEEETVVTFPTLVWKEFLAGLGCLVFLVAVSVQINAPLLQIANTAVTPNPAKAPWYFVGLQELLEHFPPVMAGVMFPTFVIIGMIVTPYLDRNPSRRPQDRKVAITLFTVYLCMAVAFVLAGQLFRGLGFNWDWTQVLGHPGLQSPY
jgi:menaquinol-cytochrome c reductase cytochrome b/c subunit